jgi:hypothetical protein
MATGNYRALYSSSLDRLFAVVGSGVYEIFLDKSWLIRGHIHTVNGPVSMTENETQLLIVDGTDGWIYNLLTNTLVQIINYNDMVDTVAVTDGGMNYRVGDTVTLQTPANGSPCTTSVYAVSTDGTNSIAQAGLTIVNSGRGYSMGDTSTSSTYGTGAIVNVETLADGGFRPASHAITLDGFFICNEINTGRFFWSYLRDGLTWDLLDYATAEGTPDNILSIGKVNNELWLFGPRTIEIWYNTGLYDNQFQRIQQGFIDIGIAAPWSNATMGDRIFWLGSNSAGYGIVYMAMNYVPKRISTHAIEHIISQMSDISDAVGYCYQQEGHHYYVLSFTAGNRTVVYDVEANMWHERSYWNATANKEERHRGQYGAFCFNKTFLADYQNTNLYELNLDTYTDNGSPIRRQRTGPHIRSDRKRLFHHQFEIDLERGVGLNSGQGSKPYISLTYSDDGGKTFGNEKKLSIGSQGKNLTRAKATRLGYSRDRVYRLTISEPVKIVLVGARADIEPERE